MVQMHLLWNVARGRAEQFWECIMAKHLVQSLPREGTVRMCDPRAHCFRECVYVLRPRPCAIPWDLPTKLAGDWSTHKFPVVE